MSVRIIRTLRPIQEDGHTDVASAKNKVKIAMDALLKMKSMLDRMDDEGDLPSWWTNKVAVAVDNLDSMADYLSTQNSKESVKEALKNVIENMLDDESAEELLSKLNK
jgi:hypothetical protein